MIRFLNVAAIAALIGSAIYAYSIKYETIWYAEQIAKINHRVNIEKSEISLLRAEWAQLTRPERIQSLAAKFLDLQPLDLARIVRANDLPDRVPRVDSIGRKLDALGLGDDSSTPRNATAGATTPAVGKR
jgi:cell division protein FtsL